jgi:glycosyltransferase involved in cell wall biosynthesis
MAKRCNDTKRVCMVAYTDYSGDARVRREAETVATLPEFEVRVLCLMEGRKPRTDKRNGVIIEELKLRKYSGKSQGGYLLSYAVFLMLAFVRVTSLFLRGNLDLVHVHNMPDLLVITSVIPRLFGKKLILDIHDTMPETYNATFSRDGKAPLRHLIGHLLAMEEVLCCGLSHKVICVNEIQRLVVVKRGVRKSKTLVSMNVPDPTIFNYSDGPRLDVSLGVGFRVVYHGTISRRLSIDVALRALASLRGRIQGLEFFIIGGGKDVEDLKRLSDSLGLTEVTKFLGKKSLEQVAELLRSMDLGVVPSARNPATELMLPVKMLECIALGIPVVVPRLPAIEFYFSEDMVSYFQPGDWQSLASAILDMYQDSTKRRSKAMAAKRFLEEYGWDKHKWGLIRAYRGIFQ